MFPAFRNDSYRLLVVSREHTVDHVATFGAKAHSFPNRELEHRRVRAHLLEEAEPLNDSIVQVDQLRFSELVDIDLHLSYSDPNSTPNDNNEPRGEMRQRNRAMISPRRLHCFVSSVLRETVHVADQAELLGRG